MANNEHTYTTKVICEDCGRAVEVSIIDATLGGFKHYDATGNFGTLNFVDGYMTSSYDFCPECDAPMGAYSKSIAMRGLWAEAIMAAAPHNGRNMLPALS